MHFYIDFQERRCRMLGGTKHMNNKPTSHTHIAVVVSTLDQEYQSDILSGIRQFAFANHITLEHFVAFGNIGGDMRHDTGEYNIFSLADFSRFDGVVLIINTIQLPDCMENVLSRVREAGIPAVCIDKDVEDLYSIGIDNTAAMRDMMEHFIHHHGFRRINYISGPVDNIDSIERLQDSSWRKNVSITAISSHGTARRRSDASCARSLNSPKRSSAPMTPWQSLL